MLLITYICSLVQVDLQSKDVPIGLSLINLRVVSVTKQASIALRRLATGDSLVALSEPVLCRLFPFRSNRFLSVVSKINK